LLCDHPNSKPHLPRERFISIQWIISWEDPRVNLDAVKKRESDPARNQDSNCNPATFILHPSYFSDWSIPLPIKVSINIKCTITLSKIL
jgi:hypothetical protein